MEPRSPVLVLLDVDSTLIEEEVIELLAQVAGTYDRVAEITASAMNGEIDFEKSLRARVATLEGLPEYELARVRARVTLTPGAQELISGVHAAGGRIGAVSGGFHEILDPLAATIGLDRWRANTLEITEGRLTGRVSGRIVDAREKANALREWAKIYRIGLSNTVAVGDGANDLAMMRAAGLSVAFDAKPAVREAADVVIEQRDLARILPLLSLDEGLDEGLEP